MSKLGIHQRKARGFIQREDWGNALVELERMLAVDADNPTLHNQVGDVYLRKEDVARACEHFERAIELYAVVGLHNNAVALCKKVMRLRPGRHELRYRMARLRLDQGFRNEAAAYLREYFDHVTVDHTDLDALEVRCREIMEVAPDVAPVGKILEKLEAGQRYAGAFEIVRKEAQRAADAGDDKVAARYTEKMRSLRILVERSSGREALAALGQTSAVDTGGAPPAARVETREAPLPPGSPVAGPETPAGSAVPAPPIAEVAKEAPPAPRPRAFLDPQVLSLDGPPADVVAKGAPAGPPAGKGATVEPPVTKSAGVEPPVTKSPAIEPSALKGSSVEPPVTKSANVAPSTSKSPGIEPPTMRSPGIEPPAARSAPSPVGRTASTPPPAAQDDEQGLVLESPGAWLASSRNAEPPALDAPDDDATSDATAADEPAPEYELPESTFADLGQELGDSVLRHESASRPDPASEWRQPPRPEPASDWSKPPRPEPASDWSKPPRPEPTSDRSKPPRPEPTSDWSKPARPEPTSDWSQPPRPNPASGWSEPAPSWEGAEASAAGFDEPDAPLPAPAAFPGFASGPQSPPPISSWVEALRRTPLWIPSDGAQPGAGPDGWASGATMELESVIDSFREQMSRALDGDGVARYDLGVAYFEMGLYNEALAEFEAASRCPGLEVQSYEMLAACLLRTGRHADVVELLLPVLAADGHTPRGRLGLQYSLGLAYEALGEREQARRCFEEVALVDIDFKDVQTRLQRIS